MTQTGKPVWLMFTVLLLLVSTHSRADLIASVDRDRVSLGDTLQLTLTATGNERLESLNLNPLNNDFQILQRSTSSSTSIVNGRRTSSRQVIIDLVARWEGTLRIPPLNAGPDTSNYLLISVGPAQTGPGKEVTLSFEAELDKDSVYVQGQAILTLRIQQAINLDSRSVTELQLDNAFVKPLEQQSFQRNIDGRPWLIHEIRYAIFPDASGTLEIPAQTFTARESSGRRSLLSRGGGRKLQRTTDALTLRVLPIPNSFSGATWLPAEALTIEETWSTPPDQLQVGESATRTIKLVAKGLQSAQLPPVEFTSIAGLKAYPDQAVTQDIESASALSGSREDSVALIPTQEGQWTIPQTEIPWWDVNAKTMRTAVLPARTIIVAKGLNSVIETIPSALGDTPAETIPFEPTPHSVSAETKKWQYTALGFALAWLLTGLYAVYAKSLGSIQDSGKAKMDSPSQASENAQFKTLNAACISQQPGTIRLALIKWSQSLAADKTLTSLDDVAALFQNAELSYQLQLLNTALYGGEGGMFDAGALMALLPHLRKSANMDNSRSDGALQLYPS